jgi:hypothetical protein
MTDRSAATSWKRACRQAPPSLLRWTTSSSPTADVLTSALRDKQKRQLELSTSQQGRFGSMKQGAAPAPAAVRGRARMAFAVAGMRADFQGAQPNEDLRRSRGWVRKPPPRAVPSAQGASSLGP